MKLCRKELVEVMGLSRVRRVRKWEWKRENCTAEDVLQGQWEQVDGRFEEPSKRILNHFFFGNSIPPYKRKKKYSQNR